MLLLIYNVSKFIIYFQNIELQTNINCRINYNVLLYIHLFKMCWSYFL